MQGKLEKHPYNLYPEMSSEEMKELVAEIKSNGFDPAFPITIYEGKVLDGWNRYLASFQCGVQYASKEFLGTKEEALFYTIRTNKRRELNHVQKALIANKYKPLLEEAAKERSLSNLKNQPSEDKDPPAKQGKTSKKLAETFDTSESAVKKVSKLEKESPELLKEVESGKKSLNKAVNELKEQKNPSASKPPKPPTQPKKQIKEAQKESGVYKGMQNDWKVLSPILGAHLDASKDFLEEFDKFIPNPGKEFLEAWNTYKSAIAKMRTWCLDKAKPCRHCNGTETIYLDENGIPVDPSKGQPVKCPYCMKGFSGE